MTMVDYHKKHMPQEMILQIGTHEDFENGFVDDSFCLGVADLIKAEIERSGGVVLSWGLHNDEAEDPENFVKDVTTEERKISSNEAVRVQGSPHLHIRFAMINKGKIDVKNTLLEHHIYAPFGSTKEYQTLLIEKEKAKTDISEKQKAVNVKKLEDKKDSYFEQKNSPKVTFTANLRSVAESYAHSWCDERGLILDDENRSKCPHMEPTEFRHYRELKDRQKLKEENEKAATELEET
ncbi:hypothetical protein [Adlercreutzia sp. ZJ304]|uniref:hypothetical protein n=1 Tax=Adlercreutzia sp. ZJ304 TaxID=2709791 RepID=UPI0013EAC5C7|nr:hypothetical protein [Adlercreutzia sp. ZJ304]